MTKLQALVVAAAGVLLAVAGLTWRFGWVGLVSSGSALILVALLVPVRERPDAKQLAEALEQVVRGQRQSG